jgi:hypothetical protein
MQINKKLNLFNIEGLKRKYNDTLRNSLRKQRFLDFPIKNIIKKL